MQAIEHIINKKKELHANTGLSVLRIVKDKLGKIRINGMPDLEKKLLSREPIVQVEKQLILKCANQKLLLEKCPSPVKEIIPAQLKHSIPGAVPAVKDLVADFVREQGSSSIKSFSLVKEKDQKSAEQPAAKKLNSLKRKSQLTVTLALNLPPRLLRDLTHEKHKKTVVIEKTVSVPLMPKNITKNECCYDYVAKSGANGKIIKVNVGLNVLNATDGHAIFAQILNNQIEKLSTK